jgi:hypothetical protein
MSGRRRLASGPASRPAETAQSEPRVCNKFPQQHFHIETYFRAMRMLKNDVFPSKFSDIRKSGMHDDAM